jgi:hypothetical protein
MAYMKNRTVHKLTEAQRDVLRAYANDTKHNRSGAVTQRLLDRGYLAQTGTIFDGLEITRSGRLALEANGG